MRKDAQQFSASDIVQAIEANIAQSLVSLGRAAGAEERNGPELQWVIGGSPVSYHNCVVRAALRSEAADDVIEEAIRQFRRHGVPGSWHIGPSTRPPDLHERLIAHGFTHLDDEYGMALDLLALPDDLPDPVTLSIERVRTEQDLKVWARTRSLGIGEGEHEAEWLQQVYSKMSPGDQGLWHHYLGRSHGRPVCTASLFTGSGVAGVYFVSTMLHVRRRGFGAAITRTVLRDACAMGYRIGVLGASRMGHSVYQRLGFRDFCKISIYEWRLS